MNFDRERFHDACRALLAQQGSSFLGLDFGRSKEGLYHVLNALTSEGVNSSRVYVPDRENTWSISIARHLVAKFQDLLGKDTWFSYKCDNALCYSKREGNQTGVHLDVRVPWEGPVLPIKCPLCMQPMQFKSRREADHCHRLEDPP